MLDALAHLKAARSMAVPAALEVLCVPRIPSVALTSRVALPAVRP